MDADTAFQAALTAERAGAQGLQRKEAEFKEAKNALKEAKAERSQAEDVLEEAAENDREAAQVAVDNANTAVSEALREVSTLRMGLNVMREAAAAAQDGGLWKRAYEAVVEERLAGLREELLGRFENWTLPEDLDTARGSLEALCADDPPPEETEQSMEVAQEPMVSFNSLGLALLESGSQFTEPEVMAMAEPTDMEMEQRAQTQRVNDGIVARFGNRGVRNTENAL